MSNILISAEMWFELVERVAAIERQHGILGPSPIHDRELQAERDRTTQELIDAAKGKFAELEKPELPVDRTKRCMLSGEPESPEHREIDPATGMQKDYVVLCPQERAKGFVKPVRRSYKHMTCGAVTTMGTALAETYARDPGFYSGTMCVNCHAHFPLKEFKWEDGEPMDPALQTGA